MPAIWTKLPESKRKYSQTEASAGGQNWHLSSPTNWDKETNMSRKREISSLIPIKWFNSCNDSLFANMTLTLHKSQVYFSGVMECWACSSPMSALCRGRLRNLLPDCSTLGVYCLTTTWQQILESSIQVMIVLHIRRIVHYQKTKMSWCKFSIRYQCCYNANLIF